MKRILSLVLSIIMVISLCACSNNKKAEKYCSSCGEGISKNSAFCEHCGAAVNNEKSESKDASSDNSSSAESKNNETINSSKTSKPTSTHTHSYAKKVTSPTCTKKGYTTYTCSCGDTYKSKYTDPKHTYSKYKCTKCGQLDKSHTYDILVDWILENGTTRGEYCHVQYSLENVRDVTISYNSKDKYVTLSLSELIYDEDEFFFDTTIIIDKISSSYYYSCFVENKTAGDYLRKLTGYLKCKKFTVNTPLTYETWETDYGADCNKALDSARLDISTILVFTHFMLSGEVEEYNNSGLTLSDLGFSSFVVEDYLQ